MYRMIRVSMQQVIGTTFLGMVFLLPMISHAETAGADAFPVEAGLAEMVLVASTDIKGAEIVGQTEDSVVVLFNLYNQVGTQSDITYGVELYETTGAQRTLVDSFVYRDRRLTLGENETVPVTLTYDTPKYLTGTYELWVVAMTPSGMTLSLSQAGEVSLVADEAYLELLQCVAMVGDESTVYQLTQGVDVAADEPLKLVCTIKNNFPETQYTRAFFETFERTVYGEQVPVEQHAQTPVVIAGGKSEVVTLTVPKALKAQAYDTVVTLVDGQGKAVSASVILHYVLQGASATIQNVVFDKSQYTPGEIAAVTVTWSPAADTFAGARGQGTDVGEVVMYAIITDTDGAYCSLPEQVSLPTEESVITLAIPVSTTCIEPQLQFELVDESGQILVGGFMAAFHEQSAGGQTSFSWQSPLVIMLGIIASLSVLVATALWLLGYIRFASYRKLWQEKPTMTVPSSFTSLGIVLAVFMAGGIYFSFSVPQTYAAVYAFDTFLITINPDDPYLVGGPADGTVRVTSSVCSNITATQYRLYLGTDLLLSGENDVAYSAVGTWNHAPFMSPGIKTILFRFNYTTGLTMMNGTPLWANTFFPVNVQVNCPTGTTWDGEQCAVDTLPPTAILSGSSCLIAVGDSACVGYATWEVFNATQPVSLRNVTSSVTYSSENTGVGRPISLAHGNNTVVVYHGVHNLRSHLFTTECESGSAWNGERCVSTTVTAPTPSAVVTATSCTIPEGSSSCTTALDWTIDNAENPNVHSQTSGDIYSLQPNGTAVPQTISYGTTIVGARDGGTTLHSTEAVATCDTDLIWTGTSCETSLLEEDEDEDFPGEAPNVTLTINGGSGPVTVPAGDTVTLAWTVTGDADNCTATGDWSGALSPTGDPVVVTVTNDSSYSMQCSGPSGDSDIETVQALVVSLPDLIPQLSISPSSVFDFATGGYSTLIINYNVENAGVTGANGFTNRLVLDRGDDGSMNETVNDSLTAGLAAGDDTGVQSITLAYNVPLGSHRVYVKADVLHTVMESNETNNERSILLPVTSPDPDISLTVDRTMVRRGDVVTLSWDINGAAFLSNCVIQGPGMSATTVYPGPQTFGTLSSGAIMTKSQYRLICTAPDSSVFTDSVTVETTGTIQEI